MSAQLLVLALLCASPPPARDAVLDALRAELLRRDELVLQGLPRPYYAAYGVDDRVTHEVDASFGALVRASSLRERTLRVDVRVGSPDLDSSEVAGSGVWLLAPETTFLPLDDLPGAIRRAAWLATDAAYKQAVERFARKRAALRTSAKEEHVPDFAPHEPSVRVGERGVDRTDRPRFEAIVRRLSAELRAFPGLEEGEVSLHARAGTRFVVTSEGSEGREPSGLAVVLAHAAARAPDGAVVRSHRSFYALDAARLPGEAALRDAVRRMADEVGRLAEAPVQDEYVGPVLFEGQAAAQFVAKVLLPRLSGHRAPFVVDPEGGETPPRHGFERRLDRRVLPAFLSVKDQPGIRTLAGAPMVGGYGFDDEAVVPREVELVDRGFLRAFLMTRRPRKDLGASNGHARAPRDGTPTAHASNLLVEAARGRSQAELEAQLLGLCRAQKMDYGLIVQLLDEPAISRSGETAEIGTFRGGRLTRPVLAYRIRVQDGRRELVRGLAFEEIPPRALKGILAAGRTAHVHHVVTRRGGEVMGMYRADQGERGVDGIPISVASPALLVDDLELRRDVGRIEPPRSLTLPGFPPRSERSPSE